MPAPVGPLLFSASLRNAASLKAVLDLVDKDYSRDAGACVSKVETQGCAALLAAGQHVHDWSSFEACI